MSDEDTKCWIYVGGLPYDLTEGDILCVFSQFGEIFKINLSRDKETGKSKGFCFIKYEDYRSCELAVDNLNAVKIIGRSIKVHYANNTTAIKSMQSTSVGPHDQDDRKNKIDHDANNPSDRMDKEKHSYDHGKTVDIRKSHSPPTLLRRRDRSPLTSDSENSNKQSRSRRHHKLSSPDHRYSSTRKKSYSTNRSPNNSRLDDRRPHRSSPARRHDRRRSRSPNMDRAHRHRERSPNRNHRRSKTPDSGHDRKRHRSHRSDDSRHSRPHSRTGEDYRYRKHHN